MERQDYSSNHLNRYNIPIGGPAAPSGTQPRQPLFTDRSYNHYRAKPETTRQRLQQSQPNNVLEIYSSDGRLLLKIERKS